MSVKLLTGAKYFLEGIRLITHPALRRFILIPIIINILLFASAFYIGTLWGIRWFNDLLQVITIEFPMWLIWLRWLLLPLVLPLFLVITFQTFGVLANVIAAPFNNLLSEKVELLLTGRPVTQKIDINHLLSILTSTIRNELEKVFYGLLLALPFLFLLIVPVIGILLWFLYTSWMAVLGYSDYPMGNHGFRVRTIYQRLRQHPALSFGFGAAVTGFGMIPVLNFIVMPSAVVGATVLWVRELRHLSSHQSAHQSRVATSSVLLMIDHLAGRISGELLNGPWQGQALEQIATNHLVELLRAYTLTDAESAEALEIYLSHERGYRNQEPVKRQNSSAPHPQTPGTAGTEPMSISDARSILGVSATATVQEIQAAHRRLMQRMHPDRGGSDYLAAKVNEAKQVLLRRVN